MKRVAFAAITISVLLAGIVAFLNRDAPRVAPTDDEETEALGLSTTTVIDRDALPEKPRKAASLRDTELDGEIGWNPDGSVRIDRALRQRFDHVLSAVGELTPADIRAGLQRDVAASASEQQAAKVMACFDRYVAYLMAVDQMAAAPVNERLSAVKALRVTVLGPEMARAFFEEEEVSDAWALARQAVQQQPGLSPEARAAALEALDQKLPVADREMAAQFEQLREVTAETAAFDEANIDADSRRAARTAKFGADVAQRLGALDEERAKWSARATSFHAAVMQIEANPKLDAAAKQQAIEALMTREFSEPEQRRVRALEKRPAP